MYTTRNQYAANHHHFYDFKDLNRDKGHVLLNHDTKIEFEITIARAFRSTIDMTQLFDSPSTYTEKTILLQDLKF